MVNTSVCTASGSAGGVLTSRVAVTPTLTVSPSPPPLILIFVLTLQPPAFSVQRSAFSVQRSASASASTSTCSPRAQLSTHVRRQRRALARLQYMYGPVYACMHVCAHVHMHVMHEKTSTGTAPVVAGLGPGPEVWGSSKGRGAASGRKGEQSAMLLITYHVSRIARHVSLITYLVSHVTHHSSLITYHPHHSPSSGRASGAQRCPPWGSID